MKSCEKCAHYEVCADYFDSTIECSSSCEFYKDSSRFKEVQTPHGRLIDADKLIRFIENGLNKNNNPFGHDAVEILTEIEFAPTIIEAEASE